jgi:hypothetical protein
VERITKEMTYHTYVHTRKIIKMIPKLIFAPALNTEAMIKPLDMQNPKF